MSGTQAATSASPSTAAPPAEREPCLGQTRSGRPCRNRAGEDSVFCHQHAPYPADGPAMFELEAPFSQVPSVLRNLPRDIELVEGALPRLRDQIGSQAASERTLKVALILENLRLRCEGCERSFLLQSTAELGELRLFAAGESWDLESLDACPLCGGGKLEIAVCEILRWKADSTFSVLATIAVMLTTVGVIWWGPLASLPLLLKLVLTVVALLVEFFLGATLWEARLKRHLRRPAPEPEREDGAETVFNGLEPKNRDRGHLSQYGDEQPSASDYRPEPASPSVTCDRCGRSMSRAEAVEIPGYVICRSCDRALEMEILRDAGGASFLR